MGDTIMRRIASATVIISLIVTAFFIPTSINNSYAATKAVPSKNVLSVPSTVKAGKSFNIKVYGDRETTPGYSTGDERYAASDWEMTGPNYYYDFWVNFNIYWGNEIYPVYSKSKKMSLPGKYKIKAKYDKYIFYKSEYSDHWDEQSSPDIKTKYINVQGKVSFNAGKGKLKKKSQKAKYINQKSKVGSLPKVKAKKGYKFKGWYTKKKGGKKISKSTKVTFTKSSKTYYAQYKKK